MKTHFIHGIISGIAAAIAGVIFLNIYQNAFFVDFSLAIDWTAITGASIIGCLLMAIGYFILDKVKKSNLRGVLNGLYIIISFASILPAIAVTLPLEVEFPELFPGMVVPMHFFPAIMFFGLKPFFKD